MMLEDNMKDTIGLVWNAATKDVFLSITLGGGIKQKTPLLYKQQDSVMKSVFYNTKHTIHGFYLSGTEKSATAKILSKNVAFTCSDYVIFL